MNRMIAGMKGLSRYRYLDAYSKLQWLTPCEIKKHQFELVKNMVTHCYATVPYYRLLFDNLKITPNDMNSFADYSYIPVLTKEIIKTSDYGLISSKYDNSKLIANASGGSTGTPLTFYHDKEIYETMEANSMLGYSMAGWSGKELFYYFWGNPREFVKKRSIPDKLKNKLSGRILFNSYNYDECRVNEWIEAICSRKNIFLYGYTSVLVDIARQVEKKGLKIYSVRGILSTAEKLHSWQRELLERIFDARVFDQYGSREVPGIACQCQEGNMHLLPHSAYIEFIDDPENPESKKIVATCLTNFAMPFLRYEIGDYARPKEGVCSCGRGFPLMEMDIGRTADSFVTPQGGTVYGTFFIRQMYGQDRVRSFQFHQVTPELINLYVVRGEGFGDEDAERLAAIEAIVRKHLATEMRVVVTFVDEIPKTGGGKHRFIVSDLVRGR